MGACFSIREEPIQTPAPSKSPRKGPSGALSSRDPEAATAPVTRDSVESVGRNGDSAKGAGFGDSARVHPQARALSIKEVQKATRNFQSEGKLGEGGYGAVYKGQLHDGTAVAVKVLNSDGGQGEREWEAEVRYLGGLNHPNLVRLVGYCSEGNQRDLVYEYMPNGSLDCWLFDSRRRPLSWDERMKVALDAAKGLAFLHEAPDRAIIFRDLKPSNVLLDSNFNAKLSDFGLAKDGPQGNKSHVSTRVMGTQGYAAPEYVFTGHLTVKSDVYTYGVVLLEIVAGRPALDTSLPNKSEQNLVQWARPFLSDKTKFSKVVDPRLDGKFSNKALKRVVILALNCLRKDANTRPCMTDVVKWLEPVQGLYAQELQQGLVSTDVVAA